MNVRQMPKPAGTDDKIRAPRQARSREGMDRALSALEQLLREKPFDSITMQDLARLSGTGTSSIYARFKDKVAMMLGVHERLRDRAAQCLEELASPARWEGKTDEQMVAGIVLSAVRFYQEHWPLIRAVLFADDPLIRERQVQTIDRAAAQFSALLVGRGNKASKKLDVAVRGACRIFVSGIYTEIIFSDVTADEKLFRTPGSLRQLTHAVGAVLAMAEES